MSTAADNHPVPVIDAGSLVRDTYRDVVLRIEGVSVDAAAADRDRSDEPADLTKETT